MFNFYIRFYNVRNLNFSQYIKLLLHWTRFKIKFFITNFKKKIFTKQYYKR